MKYLKLFLISLIIISCKKNGTVTEDPGNSDYFAFGIAYGMCQGNCATFFSLHDGKVYPDNMNYMSTHLTFQNTPLSHSEYLSAKQSLDSFPVFLGNNPNSIFGHPDSHDQGLIYIEYKKKGQANHWYLDTETDSLPVEIRNYAVEIKNIIDQLQ